MFDRITKRFSKSGQTAPVPKPAGSQAEIMDAYRAVAEAAFDLQRRMEEAGCRYSFTIHAKHKQEGTSSWSDEVSSAQDAVTMALGLRQTQAPSLIFVPKPDGRTAGTPQFDITFAAAAMDYYGLPRDGVADGCRLGYDQTAIATALIKKEISRDSRMLRGDLLTLQNLDRRPPAPATLASTPA